MNVLTVQPFPTLSTPLEVIDHFGGRGGYREAPGEMERALYSAA